MRTLPATVFALAVVLTPAVQAPGASPWPGKGPWTAQVNRVGDGDTFRVDLEDSSDERVRITGLNATETWTGDCHAGPAKERLKELIEDATVTLSAADPASMSGDRFWRWVDRGQTDVGLALVEEGLALPQPHKTEDGRNRLYMEAAAHAAAAEKGIWRLDVCKRGPYPDHRIKLWVQWDADGADSKNPNGEWVRIKNNGTTQMSLRNWWLRDSSTKHYYYFPKDTVIRAGKSVTVHVGSGVDRPRTLFAAFGKNVFLNTRPDGSGGDGAYLFDPHGDLRAYMTYPCFLKCGDRAIGSLKVSARWDAPGIDSENPNGEYVRIRNRGAKPISLHGYVLKSAPYVYNFWRSGAPAKLYPGEIMKIRSGKGRTTRLNRYWGKDRAILTNSGDRVELDNFRDVRIDCFAWGTHDC